MIRKYDDNDDDMIRLVVQYYVHDYAYNHASEMKIQCDVVSEEYVIERTRVIYCNV